MRRRPCVRRTEGEKRVVQCARGNVERRLHVFDVFAKRGLPAVELVLHQVSSANAARRLNWIMEWKHFSGFEAGQEIGNVLVKGMGHQPEDLRSGQGLGTFRAGPTCAAPRMRISGDVGDVAQAGSGSWAKCHPR